MFANRVEAGRELADQLRALRLGRVVVLGLPRGGVPVAAEVATALDAPLEVIVVRKLGLPSNPELAMGAIGENGVRVVDEAMVQKAGITAAELRAVEQREAAQLAERVRYLRRGRDRIDVRGRTAVVVDDGIATGATARAACAVARRLGAVRVVLAAPVAPRRASHSIPEADDVVTVDTPVDFIAVGQHYLDFEPTTDEAVMICLDEAARRVAERSRTGAASVPDRDDTVPSEDARSEGQPPQGRMREHGSDVVDKRPINGQIPPASDSPTDI